LKARTRYVKGELLAMPVLRGPHQASRTLPHGTKLYGPVAVRGEYVEFVWDGEKYKCLVDEFVSGTRADLTEIGAVRKRSHVGKLIAADPAGGLSKLSMKVEQTATKTESRVAVCQEQRRLLDAFGEAVQALLLLHEQQFLAIVAGDLDSHRFDLLIHMANEKKQQTKYAYLEHVEMHSCSTDNVTHER